MMQKSVHRKRFLLLLLIPVLLLAAGVTLFLPVHGEEKIYDTVVRLHVLANSDSEQDQALKLRVRDRILSVSAPLLEGCKTQKEAEEALRAGMPALEDAARVSSGRTGTTIRCGFFWTGRTIQPAPMKPARSRRDGISLCASASGRRKGKTGGACCFRRSACLPRRKTSFSAGHTKTATMTKRYSLLLRAGR